MQCSRALSPAWNLRDFDVPHSTKVCGRRLEGERQSGCGGAVSAKVKVHWVRDKERVLLFSSSMPNTKGYTHYDSLYFLRK